MSLEKLREEGLKWVEVNKSKRFSGVTKLLTDLYPDNAHFIYELLQNAEDAHDKTLSGSRGASHVKFILKDTSLEYEHDGDRLFSLKDVESITGIGDSSKLDDSTSIGKFGIGFKAVFSYTNTPEIHSGNFHFQIHDLVVPETDGVPKLNFGGKSTQFIFPFNNPKKPASQAVAEIEKGLCGFEDNTLLFLTHIRKIDYRLPNGTSGSLERIDHEHGHIEIRSSHPDKSETISHWLRFEKDVEVKDENGEQKSCRIAIAYSMEEDENKKKKGTIWKIVPLERGQVSIFFPAEKESSNLRFHMHAPFASTVARDSVRICDANNTLRDHLAELIVDSLVKIRNMGMLSVVFMAVLPNPNDNLPELYKPIQSAIMKAFKSIQLTPTQSGSHAKVDSLYVGPSKISEVLGDEGLSAVTGNKPPLWAANPPPQHQRSEHFLASLGIYEFGWKQLCERLRSTGFSSASDTEKQARIESWISKMKDNKLLRFYALLGEAYSSQSKDICPYSLLKIIRVTSENGDEHVVAKDAFLQTVEGEPPPGIRYVKAEVYNKGRSDEQKRFAKMFLERVGTRSFDENEAILLKIATYSTPSARVPKNYLKDVTQFVESFLKNPEDFKKLEDIPFLRGTSQDGSTHWGKPTDFFIDQPFMDTGLNALFNDTSIELKIKKRQLLSEYQMIPRFTQFANNIGVMNGLEIRPYYATKLQENEFPKSGRTTETTEDDDHYFNNLNSPISTWRCESSPYNLGEIQLSSSTFSLSVVIWKTMCRARQEQLEARYLPNASKRYEERRGPSLLVKQLRAASWIPDIEGTLKKPSDICKEELHPDLHWDNRNGWLTAIGIGENVRKLSEEYQSKNQAAQNIGFDSIDRASKWAELDKAGIDPEELLSKHKKPELPEGAVNNPERRRKRMLDDSANAPEKECVKRERSIQMGIPLDRAEAKAYLRPIYTNSDEELICQCCHNVMPFKHKDNFYYFEAIQCISDLKKRCIENRLALCPTCSAMYQYARNTDDTELRNRLVSLDEPDTSPSVEVPISLAGRECRLHFVGKHWFDLKAILESE